MGMCHALGYIARIHRQKHKVPAFKEFTDYWETKHKIISQIFFPKSTGKKNICKKTMV